MAGDRPKWKDTPMTKTKTEDASPVVPKVPTLSAMPDYLIARATKASARFADRKVNSMSLQKTWLDHVRMTALLLLRRASSTFFISFG